MSMHDEISKQGESETEWNRRNYSTIGCNNNKYIDRADHGQKWHTKGDVNINLKRSKIVCPLLFWRSKIDTKIYIGNAVCHMRIEINLIRWHTWIIISIEMQSMITVWVLLFAVQNMETKWRCTEAQNKDGRIYHLASRQHSVTMIHCVWWKCAKMVGTVLAVCLCHFVSTLLSFIGDHSFWHCCCMAWYCSAMHPTNNDNCPQSYFGSCMGAIILRYLLERIRTKWQSFIASVMGKLSLSLMQLAQN